MGSHSDYRSGLLARFAGREVLSKDEMYKRFWAGEGLSRSEVFELLELIEQVYGISAGLLRPSDPADKLTQRVPERKWWRGPVHDVIAGDREFWLQEEFEKKLKEHGLSGKIERADTIDELMRAWCGKG